MKKRITSSIILVGGVSLSLLFLAALSFREQPVGLLAVFALLLCGVILCGILLSRSIVAPFRQIDPEKIPKTLMYEELSPLVRFLEKQNTTIEKQLARARQTQEEFRVLSENMEEGILITDRHGTVLSSNTAARHFRESGSMDAEEVLTTALEGRHAEKAVVREGRYYRLLGSPVTQNDRIAGAVVLILDETQKRSLEQYRKEFTANVSHELKTPLTSISGFAELMQNGMVAEKDIPDFAASIYSEARRLLTLVNDIIRLSRIEDGTLPYESGDVDLYRVAAEALSHVKDAANQRGIALVLEGTSQTVHGAEPILYDVVYNLCDNGVKYNRDGGKVTVYVGEGENGTLLTVTDNGIGIPDTHKERIFERFYRVDKSHSKEIGGTGLGLSIVRHGVEYHGGTVTLDSEEGKGTTVTLLFPSKE